ncbi:hypothetical protein [Novosphingobium sp. FKTRR1]|uniref:hypothetical protein n=1 Tax=Novosphingobium sp. FKTRR1 TaxID=2879118 RepID=UPI00351D9369
MMNATGQCFCNGGQGLAIGDQAVDAVDPRGPAIRQDQFRPFIQIIVIRFADALSQPADFGTALLNGSSLKIQCFGLGLHLGEAVVPWHPPLGV